jgi:serine/threonine-protein kinase
MIHCYQCGTDNLDGTEYCDECGKHLLTATDTSPSQLLLWVLFPFYLLFLAFSRILKIVITPINKFFAFLRADNSGVNARLISPFANGTGRHEVAIPLARSFRYGHEPVGTNDEPAVTNAAARFVGRQAELNVLAQRILFSNGGSFLVTGYRGVGKTSFINQVVRKLNEALPWAKQCLEDMDMEIVDIYLNIARPVQPAELMHYIIRQLYDRLVKKHIYQLLDDDLRDELTLAYQRTSVNMARKMAEASERNFGFNEASLGGEFLKATVKASWVAKRSRTQNYEMTFLSYDDKAAEHDIISIARRLTEGYVRPLARLDGVRRIFNPAKRQRVKLKIVFVFDELDKLEEFTTKVEGKDEGEQKPVIDVILGTLKNLFTTSGLTFVFVAGKDLQERWLEDVGKGDSVYESVFSYDKYLPCLWADVDSICDGLVDPSQALLPSQRQVFGEFKKYLAYKGRGIPRRIIRTFNEYVEWSGDQPTLTFSRQRIRTIRFYAELQGVLSANEDRLFGDSHEEVLGTQSDKRRLAVYYLIDWILRQGVAEFTLDNVRIASKRLSAKIALAEEIVPSVAEDIIKILLDGDFIQEVHKLEYRVFIGDANAIDDANVMAEKRYRLIPRRLVEIGGLAADAEAEMGFEISGATITAFSKAESITSIGKYKIIRELGRGGMGAVYEATDEYSGRKVAVKVTADSANDEWQARFEREALIMNELNHPNVVRLYDWGRDNDRLYIAMEYLDGLTLEEVIKRRGKLRLDLVVAIAKPVAEAAHYVHQKGFVRNDIKPNNIMLTTSGRVCLLDFGITKPAISKPEIQSKFDTETSLVIGTPHFMAPEQFQLRIADERSDIYSLGIILYKMLTGVFPFDGSDYSDLIKAHAEQPPVPPSHLVSLPTEIDEVVLKCLEKDPGNRFQTMAELADALIAAAGELPHVDLRSVVSVARKEAKEIEQMNQLQTLVPTDSFNPLMHGAASLIVARSDDSVIPALSLPRPVTDTLSAATVPPELLLSEAKDFESSDTRTRITLIRGRAEDVDFHLATFRTSYLLEKKTSIGRSSENDISLSDPKISRYHAELTADGENWFIGDFNSILGTFVNGEKIITRQLLKDQDEIQIGDFVFIFQQAALTK